MANQKYIRIVKFSDKKAWYKYCIGLIYPVINEYNGSYTVLKDIKMKGVVEHCNHIGVLKCDVEEVELVVKKKVEKPEIVIHVSEIIEINSRI